MAKISHQIDGNLRDIKGRKVKKLRKEGILPATMYGKGFEPMTVQTDQKKLEEIFAEAGESGLVEVTVNGEKYPVMLRNPQYHPLFGDLMHIDFYKVNLKEKIASNVAVEIIGESPAVKGGLVLVEVSSEVEVEGLPTDLPEKIEVDISKLEKVDDTITVADLNIDRSKLEVLTDAEQVIVKIEEPKEEEVVETEAVAPSEVPATEQKAPEEGEAGGEEKKEEK
jgi:large subunit ribosomal protein L25